MHTGLRVKSSSNDVTKEDKEFLSRVKKEQDERGLVLEENVDESGFHKVVQRLIEEPPAPKRKRGKRLKLRAPKAPKR
jgi:hypothetical protein